MKVTVSVLGRYYAFQLAEQLEKKNMLQRLITTYPKFEAVKYGVPRPKIRSLLDLELLLRGIAKAPLSKQLHETALGIVLHAYDLRAPLQIPKDTDLLVGWSGVSLSSIRKARKLGAKSVVVRCSTHILFQKNILEEESRLTGIVTQTPSDSVVERELREYEEADFVQVQSKFVEETFLAHGIPKEKILCVPQGVDLDQYRPIKKEDSVFRIIFCGGIIIRKGVQYLLQAFSELNLPNAELWLVGSLAPEGRLLMEKYAGSNVFHKGPYSQKELYRIYSQGSLFCLPSLEEGIAEVQAQAMACELPVLCSTNSGGPELIREGEEGYIVPIRDVNALKEKILFFYENPERCRSMGIAARKRVESGFGWNDYGEKISTLYKRIGPKKHNL